MKKTALALALAGMAAAPLAALADTTVYGSLRVSETYTDIKGGDSYWDVRNESSRLGFKGSEDLGNGLAAIYHYEFGVDAAATAEIGGPSVGGRLAYVGLKGGWGQVSLGRQWNPYYFAVGGEVDIFNGINSSNGYYGNTLPAAVGTDTNGSTSQTRSGDMLLYQTPSFNGLVASAAVVNNGASGDDGADTWQLAATYDNGGLFLGAGWRQASGDTLVTGEDADQYGVQARYNFGMFGLAGSYQRVDPDGQDTVDDYDVVASVFFGNNLARLAYYDVEDTSSGWILGLQHNLSKRSRLWIEYGDNSVDDPGTDNQEVSIGMRHDF